jgi:hypothetical protein
MLHLFEMCHRHILKCQKYQNEKLARTSQSHFMKNRQVVHPKKTKFGAK